VPALAPEAPLRLLVTGAGGFVGRHLLPVLRRSFPRITLIAALRPGDVRPGDVRPDGPGLGADETIVFDLLQPDMMAPMLRAARPDGLVHLAAQASVSASFADPMASWRANLLGTLALGEAVMREAPGCRFVLASSAEVYGLSFRAPMPLDERAPMRPANPYAASKAACDLAIGEMALRGLDAVRLRAFNHTGPGQSEGFVVAAFARQIARVERGLQAPELRVGALDRWRDFLDVRDVCAAYAAALRGPTSDITASEPGLALNLASGMPRRIGDILNALLSRSTARPRVEVETTRLRPTDVERVAGDAARARDMLGWAPVVPWDKTLDDVLEYWRGRVRQGAG
jgi:GDP-4-dehydro-6-deoxy-D-mannose reductase